MNVPRNSTREAAVRGRALGADRGSRLPGPRGPGGPGGPGCRGWTRLGKLVRAAPCASVPWTFARHRTAIGSSAVQPAPCPCAAPPWCGAAPCVCAGGFAHCTGDHDDDDDDDYDDNDDRDDDDDDELAHAAPPEPGGLAVWTRLAAREGGGSETLHQWAA